MSDLRARFEAIFNQHGRWNPDGGKTYATSDAQGLLDALVAAVPTVTRNDIEKVVVRGIPSNDHHDYDDWRSQLDQLIDCLHALVTGATEKVWCEHWYQVRPDLWKFNDGDATPGSTGFAYASWKLCPVCGTPRPAGV